MKSTACVMFAGLASAASAQSLQVHLSWDQTGIFVGETAVATLTASFTTPTAGGYFASISADLIANEDIAEVGAVQGLDWANAALGTPDGGSSNGSSLGGIFGSQIALFPPVDTGNPFVIGTFEVIGVGPGFLSYTAVVRDGPPVAFSVADGAPFAAPVFFDGAVFTSDQLRIGIPSPSGGVLLGLGGLLACRRCR